MGFRNLVGWLPILLGPYWWHSSPGQYSWWGEMMVVVVGLAVAGVAVGAVSAVLRVCLLACCAAVVLVLLRLGQCQLSQPLAACGSGSCLAAACVCRGGQRNVLWHRCLPSFPAGVSAADSGVGGPPNFGCRCCYRLAVPSCGCCCCSAQCCCLRSGVDTRCPTPVPLGFEGVGAIAGYRACYAVCRHICRLCCEPSVTHGLLLLLFCVRSWGVFFGSPSSGLAPMAQAWWLLGLPAAADSWHWWVLPPSCRLWRVAGLPVEGGWLRRRRALP